ncbi:MAG: hypothetical protein SAK29_28210 [Scytonema sp. PMC 1069.18]|nr:hypothetical protein [Scytonema sp. PMC 1069.18]MEC4883893.1 hypothetical protein [Scytonema sp. PMC 1070.18]
MVKKQLAISYQQLAIGVFTLLPNKHRQEQIVQTYLVKEDGNFFPHTPHPYTSTTSVRLSE